MSEVDCERIERMVNKLLDKAGNDPRLTPRLLREKTEQRLDLKKDQLKSSRTLIKELICSWWKKNNNESNNSCGDGVGSKIAKNGSRGLSNGGSSTTSNKVNDNNNNNSAINNSSDSLEKEQWKALVKLARVSGCKNEVLSNLNESLSTKQKYDIICSRLRNKGLNFSTVPTEKEIAEAEKAYQLRKELESLQGDNIKTSSSTLNKGVLNHNHAIISIGDNGYNHDINSDKKDGNNNNENNRKRSLDETVTRSRDVKTKIETENNRKPSKHQFTDQDEEAEF